MIESWLVGGGLVDDGGLVGRGLVEDGGLVDLDGGAGGFDISIIYILLKTDFRLV